MAASPRLQPDIDMLIRTAIKQRRLLRLRYKDLERVVEPHDYGIHNGAVKLFAYQVGGSSSQKLPNWRWIETASLSEVQLLDQTFAGGRATSSGQHHKWDELFLRVEQPRSV